MFSVRTALFPSRLRMQPVGRRVICKKGRRERASHVATLKKKYCGHFMTSRVGRNKALIGNLTTVEGSANSTSFVYWGKITENMFCSGWILYDRQFYVQAIIFPMLKQIGTTEQEGNRGLTILKKIMLKIQRSDSFYDNNCKFNIQYYNMAFNSL